MATPGALPILKDTGEPDNDPLVAARVLVPTIVPSVQLPTVATPLLLVIAVPPVIVPPPALTENVTVTPTTGFPLASRTITLGGTATAAPTVPVVLPPFAAICVADPGTAVAVILIGVLPGVLTLKESAPAVERSVHPLIVALPDASVVTVPGCTLEPLALGVSVTVVLLTGFPSASNTWTTGAG